MGISIFFVGVYGGAAQYQAVPKFVEHLREAGVQALVVPASIKRNSDGARRWPCGAGYQLPRHRRPGLVIEGRAEIPRLRRSILLASHLGVEGRLPDKL